MYATGYGYGQGGNMAAFQPGMPAPGPHQQQQQSQQQQQQQHQQQAHISQQQQQQQQQQQPQQAQPPHQQPSHPQQMMYNAPPQQFYNSHPPPPPQQQQHQHPPPFQAGPGLAQNQQSMAPRASGGLGIMPNGGMPHMGPGGGNGPYQTSYPDDQYGNLMATASMPGPPTYMPPNAGAYAMGQGGMMHSRMQAPMPTSAPMQGGARQSSYGNVPTNTPPNAPASQFPAAGQMRAPTPKNGTQPTSAGTLTPQTPNFPPGAPTPTSNSNLAQPMSPVSEHREKERVTLLLDINRELFHEIVYLQGTQAQMKQREDEKSEATRAAEGPEDLERQKAEMQRVQRAYFECMKRLQGNLSYLAAIADRPNKPASQIPAQPASISAPYMLPRPLKPLESRAPEGAAGEASELTNADEGLQERVVMVNAAYKKLQSLFPSGEPAKDVQSMTAPARSSQPPSMPPISQSHMAPQNAHMPMGQGGAMALQNAPMPMGNGGAQAMNTNMNHMAANGAVGMTPEQQQQQQLQHEMRHRMMMQEQAQAQAQAQAQQQRAGMAMH